jgi:hypothetical protein
MLLSAIQWLVAAASLFQQIHEIAGVVSRVAGVVAVALMVLASLLGAS